MRSVVVLLGACLVACGPEDPLARVEQSGPLRETFAISDVFAPSGHMGDGEERGHLKVDVANDRCKARPPGAKGHCYRFTYEPGAYGWAGVYWVYPANNWGSRAGRSIDGRAFKHVRVTAATDADELPVNFLVGGIADPTLPNRDRVSAATSERIGPEWKTIYLDVSGQDFDRVIGALAWSLAYPMDWDGSRRVVLYLDDLVWDTEAAPAP